MLKKKKESHSRQICVVNPKFCAAASFPIMLHTLYAIIVPAAAVSEMLPDIAPYSSCVDKEIDKECAPNHSLLSVYGLTLC